GVWGRAQTALGAPRRSGGLPYSENRRLRHGGSRSRRRAQAAPRRQAERSRARRTWNADWRTRYGGRKPRAVRGRVVRGCRKTHLHAIRRKPRALIGSGRECAIGRLAGFRKLDDLVCYRLLDVVGAVSGPQADADLFERDAKDAHRFLIELFAV